MSPPSAYRCGECPLPAAWPADPTIRAAWSLYASLLDWPEDHPVHLARLERELSRLRPAARDALERDLAAVRAEVDAVRAEVAARRRR